MKENDPKKENKVCPNCFSVNTNFANFCKKCMRPLGDFVNYDPVNRILSTGWMYRKSTSSPSSPIIFYGIWVLFGVPLLLMLPVLLQPMDIGIFLIIIPYIIVSSFILYKTTRNYKINKKSSINQSAEPNSTPKSDAPSVRRFTKIKKVIKNILSIFSLILGSAMLILLGFIILADAALHRYCIEAEGFYLYVFLVTLGALFFLVGLYNLIFKKPRKPLLISIIIFLMVTFILSFGYIDKLNGVETVRQFLNCYQEKDSYCLNELFYESRDVSTFFEMDDHYISEAHFSNVFYGPAKYGTVYPSIVEKIPNEGIFGYREVERSRSWEIEIIKDGMNWKIDKIDYNH